MLRASNSVPRVPRVLQHPMMTDTCHPASPRAAAVCGGKWRLSANAASATLHTHTNPWTPTSWKELGYPARQQPPYRHQEAVESAVQELRRKPPLVSEESIQQLGYELKELILDEDSPKKFIIQAGDCAEPMQDCYDHDTMAEKIEFLHELGDIVERKSKDMGAHITPILIGRIAGQFAKSRSNEYDSLEDGTRVVSYRGDSVNDIEPTSTARDPDPQKLVDAYSASKCTSSCFSIFKYSDSDPLVHPQSCLTSGPGVHFSRAPQQTKARLYFS
eukprot:gb/GECG01003432.1/.p1 GENE.gb/GECG01003432.1/~~gb/GECG01003432.1/.p1  ORF type:complete len:274 (+),score=23.07 gb/GECG01003432.1/:1-822(+)